MSKRKKGKKGFPQETRSSQEHQTVKGNSNGLVQTGERLGGSYQGTKKPEMVVEKRRAVGRVVFSPYAWSKLLWFRYRGDTEVSGFGVSSMGDPLYVVDFVTVPQEVTEVTTEMDDVGVADFFEDMHEKGLQPCEYGRIWIHTHPGMGVSPSSVDEKCFGEVFGRCDWSVMMIVGGDKKDQKVYCRLGFNIGPGTEVLLETGVDWTGVFGGSDHQGWEAEYQKNVHKAYVYNYGGAVGVPGIGEPGKVEYMGFNEYDGWAEEDDEVDDTGYNALWCKAMGRDVDAITELGMMSENDVAGLLAMGFDPGQILWYDSELLGYTSPDDLDEWGEEQRKACNSGYNGSIGFGQY